MIRKKIVLAVTIDDSLQFLRGYPEYLVERGWEVHVVSNAGPRLAQLSSMAHVHTHAIKMDRRPNLVQDMRSLSRWLALTRRIRPVAVSVGTPKAGLLGTVSAWALRVPIRIYLLRGLRLETSTGVSRSMFALAERIAMMCATHVLAISPSLRRRAVELRLVSAAKIRVLGHGSSNGTDTAEFDSSRFDISELNRLRRECGLVPGIPVVGYVGRLTRDKGLFVLADALDALFAQGTSAQLLVVGGG